jgi:hypothetical protein
MSTAAANGRQQEPGDQHQQDLEALGYQVAELEVCGSSTPGCPVFDNFNTQQ